jgi:hypothetical protein
MVDQSVTLGVGTVGNIEALNLCISSVLNGLTLPGKILIRSEGEFPAFSNFYLEQLAELARIKGVEFQIVVLKSQGARKGCDWLLNNCTTELLWLVDDDVIFDTLALDHLLAAKHDIEKKVKGTWSFICGNKRDVNNRRGYGDFSQKELEPPTKDFAHTNLFYKQIRTQMYPECVALDSGHVLFNMNVMKHSGLRFAHFKEDFNSGGYDSFLGILCTKSGYKGYFTHMSVGWHLEKQKQNFGEFSQRKAYLVRAAEAAGIADGQTEYKPFGWVPNETTK